jgi:hypothetical protein
MGDGESERMRTHLPQLDRLVIGREEEAAAGVARAPADAARTRAGARTRRDTVRGVAEPRQRTDGGAAAAAPHPTSAHARVSRHQSARKPPRSGVGVDAPIDSLFDLERFEVVELGLVRLEFAVESILHARRGPALCRRVARRVSRRPPSLRERGCTGTTTWRAGA